MKVSLTAFVTLALDYWFGMPTVQHGPGKRGLVWPYYNGGLDPGRLNDHQGTVNLMCVMRFICAQVLTHTQLRL
jgi:hypothetical protein